jgi:hypothetical protein
MNLLDENIHPSERDELRRRKIKVRQIGYDIGQKGFDDTQQIIPLLMTLKNPTLFTRDRLFVQAKNRHIAYCLVYLDVPPDKAAETIRRFLKHPDYNTVQKRLGKIIHIGETALSELSK